ncbi:diguanylate phosphodiesterase [Campylobacter pinnipediorum subsp. caledonicus]|uniref:Diguanylate phosphodiesterase n=2 Tax=Campylobacter TaxID=194 RepID=A0A1S6U8S7_9BACT|nr:diguanylate phosphodiesterase [Campylobacter pinnipediorum subsp. caledonicus]
MLKLINNIKKDNTSTLIQIITIFCAYAISLFLHYDIISHVLSVVLNLYMSIIIYKNISIANNKIKKYWLFTFGYIFAWGICDTLWLFLYSNQNSFIINSIYLIPTLIILCTTICIYKTYLKDTNSRQIATDILFTSFISISLFIFIIFDNEFEDIETYKDHILNGLFLIIDIFNITTIAILYTCIENLKKDYSLYLLTVSILIFSGNDILDIFGAIKNENISYIVSEIFFSISFLAATLSSFLIQKENDKNFIASFEPTSSKLIKKLSFLMLVPILSSFYIQHLNMTYIIFSMLIVVFYSVLTYQLSSIKYNKEMIEKEKKAIIRLNITKQNRLNELNNTNIKLKELVMYDALTRVFNRPYFIAQLSELISTKSYHTVISLYIINIKNIKNINNTYSYQIGDQIIVQTTNRIKEFISKKLYYIMGRFGRDDILIAIKEKNTDIDYNDFANGLLSHIQKPLIIENNKIKISAKIGISSTETSQIKVQDLISQANMALNVAKKYTPIPFYIYTEDLNIIKWEDYHIKNLLENADFDKEFRLIFQPQFNIKNKKIIGFEALLRWNSSSKGNIPPSKFIPIAEQDATIIKIGKWVVVNSVKYIKYINEKYKTNLSIGINISSKQMDGINFANNIINLIKKNNIDPKWINIEISELDFSDNYDIAKEILHIFKQNNINISMDNFGTGFSSISAIKQFNINKLKITKKLIDEVRTDVISKDIVKAIVSLAKVMNIKTIAEGVSSEEQLEVLKNIGCDEIQGFIWSEPLESKDFECFLKNQISV